MNDLRLEDVPLTIKADAAFRQAAKKVILQAEQTATPVIIWKENRIQEIPVDQLKRILMEMQSEDE